MAKPQDKGQIVVKIEGLEHYVYGQGGQELLPILLQNKIPINHVCDGMGSCGTCRVYVLSELKDLPERNELEAERAEERGFAANERLACQLCVEGQVHIKIPPTTD